MRITVIRTGGFGGLTRRATLETEGRPDGAEIASLARDARAAGRSTRPMGVPDGFHYEITVDDTSPVHCADPSLSEAQSALITRVLKEGV